MKDFDLCYFVWRILYKNNITLTSSEDENFNLYIQMIGNKSNISEKVLVNIVAQLLIQDLKEDKKTFVIDKPDYKDYLKFLKESELMYRSNLLGDKIFLQDELLNENVINYLVNFISAMLINYSSCEDDINKLIDLATKSILSHQIETLDYTKMPSLYSINMLYKCLIIAFKEKKAYDFAADNIKKTGDFTRSQIDAIMELSENGKSEKEINDVLDSRKSQFESMMNSDRQSFNEDFDKYDFFGKGFH